ncbi:MAG: RNA polymerase sigma factor [Pseudomonadales bacterium]|nr:RNA polymerase sigma factor [Pseudomonadales bacterium]
MLGYDYELSAERRESKPLRQQLGLENFLAGVERKAYRMARIATGNQEEALDIVQDAMLKLVEKYGDKPESELAPLFYRILQSRIRDWYRRSSVRNRFRSWLGRADGDEDEEDPLQLLPDPAGKPPEELLALQGGMEALEDALRRLPLRQQQVFLLRAWEGLDVRQTAQAMHCAEGSVKTHYSRALSKLRERLGEHYL